MIVPRPPTSHGMRRYITQDSNQDLTCSAYGPSTDFGSAYPMHLMRCGQCWHVPCNPAHKILVLVTITIPRMTQGCPILSGHTAWVHILRKHGNHDPASHNHSLALWRVYLTTQAAGAGSENQTSETGSTEVAARGAFVERRAKAKLALAAEHFNRDYKKGFQYLQVSPCGLGTAKLAPNSFLLAETCRVVASQPR